MADTLLGYLCVCKMQIYSLCATAGNLVLEFAEEQWDKWTGPSAEGGGQEEDQAADCENPDFNVSIHVLWSVGRKKSKETNTSVNNNRVSHSGM